MLAPGNSVPTSYGKIVDRRGQPVAYGEFFESANRYQGGDFDGINTQNGAQDFEKLLSVGSWQQLMTAGRFLFANVPVLRGALLEMALYSFPLEPVYCGKDKDWGRLASEWLYGWRQIQNTKGANFNSQVGSRLRLFARKTDGDIGTVLVNWGPEGYPKKQFIRAHRIGNRDLVTGILDKGPYKGCRICNGVVLDKHNGHLAYNVLGSSRDEDQFIPAHSMQLSFNPDFSDQVRGYSELTAGVQSFRDIKRLRDYEMRSQQIQATFAVVESTEDSDSPPGSDNATRTATGLNILNLEKGLIKYVAAKSGGGLELLRPDRPGPGCQEFENRIISGAFYGIGWDPNFALAIKEPGGVWARTIIKKIQHAIKENQRLEALDQLREDTFALSRAIDLGILPEPKDGDIFSWNYYGPARFSADAGNEERARLEKLKVGAITLETIAAEDGGWWLENREQKETEARDLLTRASAIRADFPELTLQECIQLLHEGNNGNIAKPAAPETEDEPSAKPKQKEE